MRFALFLIMTFLFFCPSASYADAADSTFSLRYDGLERTYLLHLPATYDATEPLPLLLAFHGFKGSGEAMKQLTLDGFNTLSDKHGFIVVYPNSVEQSWNVLQEEPAATDDVGFVRALIKDLGSRFNIDSSRIYATGMSSGGYFSNRLACELSDVITAIAPVAGTMPELVASDCSPVRPMPVVMIHGTKDNYAKYNGGKSGRGILTLSAENTAKFWAMKNGCAPVPSTVKRDIVHDKGSVRKIRYSNCNESADVLFYRVHNGGHTWPGGLQYLPSPLVGRTSKDINACEEIWAFLSQYKK